MAEDEFFKQVMFNSRLKANLMVTSQGLSEAELKKMGYTHILLATGAWPALDVPVSPLIIAIGGVIVGLGASFGSGCTSGHGVCGLSRLSLRSLVAVPTFMATAAITVFVIRHVIGA